MALMVESIESPQIVGVGQATPSHTQADPNMSVGSISPSVPNRKNDGPGQGSGR